MAVNNEVYDELADGWWDETGFLHGIKTLLNPPRMAYLRRVLLTHGRHPGGLEILDVGCGGGLLSEEIARLGPKRLVGVDPSRESIAVARRHAADSGLSIEYEVARGEELPFDDASFDFVACCDTLEHVDDVRAVVAQVSRVLRPGGIFAYDTINRNAFSRLIAIQLLQEWRLTRINPPGLHDWEKFLKPEEMEQILAENGLQTLDLVGLDRRLQPLRTLWTILQCKRGKITHAEAGRRLPLSIHPTRTRFLYMAHGLKA